MASQVGPRIGRVACQGTFTPGSAPALASRADRRRSALQATPVDAGTLDALILGAVQGLTEFLPVSSSGHVALGQRLFGMREGNLTLSVMLHAGTLLATIVVLRRRVATVVVDTLAFARDRSPSDARPGARDALVVGLASLPTGVAGLALRDAIERWSGSLSIVGGGFVVTTLLLVSTRFVRASDRPVPTWLGALALGVAQSVALLPGISRSGTTIVAALWLGVRPDRAFELSMLMSLPAVLGATLLEARHLLSDPSGAGVALAGAGVAFVVGAFALRLLRGLVDRGRLSWFALWVGPVALLTLAVAARQTVG